MKELGEATPGQHVAFLLLNMHVPKVSQIVQIVGGHPYLFLLLDPLDVEERLALVDEGKRVGLAVEFGEVPLVMARRAIRWSVPLAAIVLLKPILVVATPIIDVAARTTTRVAIRRGVAVPVLQALDRLLIRSLLRVDGVELLLQRREAGQLGLDDVECGLQGRRGFCSRIYLLWRHGSDRKPRQTDTTCCDVVGS